MAQFNNLKSLYDHLEKHGADYPGAHRISSLFGAVYNKLKDDEGKRNEADQALWERWFFRLKFTAGNMESWCGHITQEFDAQIYAYAAERLRSAQNPVLRARYAHVLWCGPNRQIIQARIAVDSYLEAVKAYEIRDQKEPQGLWGLEVLFAIRNAYGLAVRTQYKITEVKAEMLRLIKHFNPKSSRSFGVRIGLVKVILDDRRHFERVKLVGLQNVCWRLARAGMKRQREENIHDAICMLDLGEKIDKRLKRNSHDWSLSRGKCYEILMQIRQEGDLAIPGFCLDAINNYRKAGKTAKARALEGRYGELAGSIRLGGGTVSIDQTEVGKRGRELAEKMTKWRPEKVISFLIHQQELLPRYADVQMQVSTGNIEPILVDMASTTIDDRGHTSRHFCGPNERLYRTILQLYGWKLSFNMPVIHQVFVKTIGKQKLSAASVLEYLKKRSWLGKELCMSSPTVGTRRYRWSQVLEPSFDGYFDKMLKWLRDRTSVPNLVLEIDSLTLKFEGMLRDLLQISGMPTFRQKPDWKGRATTEEKDLGALLYDESIGLLFEDNDLFFLRFLLTEKSGYNLRASVAHSLLLPQDYNLDYMHLLLLALLKLAKYDLAQNTEIVVSRVGSAFHLANCTLVRRIQVKNRIVLMSSKSASRKGYAACQMCKPKHPRANTSGTQPVLVVRS